METSSTLIKEVNFKLEKNKTLNATFTNNSEVELEENSHLNITQIGEAKDFKITLKENSELNLFILDLSGNELNKIIINLEGNNSRVNMNLRTYTDKLQVKKFDIEINHLNKNTHSSIINYGIATDESNISMNVVSQIKKGNSKSTAYQNTKVISLSEKASAYLNPILEIKEFDVLGGHSATFSKITQEEIYYLQSRGFTKEEAMNVITLNTLMYGTKEDVEAQIIRRIEYGTI